MESRAARLEEEFRRIDRLLISIDERLRRVEVDMAAAKARAGGFSTEIAARTAHLPTTLVLVTTVIGSRIAWAIQEAKRTLRTDQRPTCLPGMAGARSVTAAYESQAMAGVTANGRVPATGGLSQIRAGESR